MAELALADWKYSRVFRVMTMDQGHLGFADLRFVRDLGRAGHLVPVIRAASNVLVLA